MMFLSIPLCVSVLLWYLMGSVSKERLSSAIGIFLSGFFVYWYWNESIWGVVVHGILGVVFLLLYWVAGDSGSTNEKSSDTPKTSNQADPQTSKSTEAEQSANEQFNRILNYQNLWLCGYTAKVVGNVDNYSIQVNTNNGTYTFKVHEGNICSCRSSNMRNMMNYEVN